jgi:polygalacturonase
MSFVVFLCLAIVASSFAIPVPDTDDDCNICTFTDASEATQSQGSCSTIVLSGISVPAGSTLDLSELNDGTTV